MRVMKQRLNKMGNLDPAHLALLSNGVDLIADSGDFPGVYGSHRSIECYDSAFSSHGLGGAQFGVLRDCYCPKANYMNHPGPLLCPLSLQTPSKTMSKSADIEEVHALGCRHTLLLLRSAIAIRRDHWQGVPQLLSTPAFQTGSLQDCWASIKD